MDAPGWEALYKPLIDRCNAEGVSIFQIKEKLGGLRFYVNGEASKDLHAAINAACAKSEVTCMKCGKPGVLRVGDWLATLCDEHAGGRKSARGT